MKYIASASRVTLTLRVVCGLPTASITRLLLLPEPTVARAALLAQCGRREDAAAAYRDALALEPAGAVRRHVTGQIAALADAAPAPTEET